MRSSLSYFAALVVVVAVVCVSAMQPAPRFILDLSKPAINRWDGAVNLVLKHHSWNNSFGPLIAHYNKTLATQLNAFERVQLYAALPQMPDIVDELTGIENQFAAVGHPEVDLHFLVTWVWFHELDHANDLKLRKSAEDHRPLKKKQEVSLRNAACTGIISLPSDPALPVVHGRNLDQNIFDGRNLTLQIDVYANATEAMNKKQNPLFQGIDFYWMSTGFVTAQMVNGVTMQENWRYQSNLTLSDILNVIANQNAVPQTRMFRNLLQIAAQKQQQALAANTTFDVYNYAMQYLTTTQFASPFYTIMSGTKRRGAVLSLSMVQADTVVESIGTDGKWYMVQTNYDRWKPDPSFDPRRTKAEQTLDFLGQEDGATDLGIWQTISTYPVHNAHTYYSAILSTGKNSTRGFIRMGMIPDPAIYGKNLTRANFSSVERY